MYTPNNLLAITALFYFHCGVGFVWPTERREAQVDRIDGHLQPVLLVLLLLHSCDKWQPKSPPVALECAPFQRGAARGRLQPFSVPTVTFAVLSHVSLRASNVPGGNSNRSVGTKTRLKTVSSRQGWLDLDAVLLLYYTMNT